MASTYLWFSSPSIPRRRLRLRNGRLSGREAGSRYRLVFGYVVIVLWSMGLQLAHGGDELPKESSIDSSRFFETHIRPLFLSKCVSCHGEKEQMAELRLDSGDALRQGSKNGPIVKNGDAKNSRLMEVVRRTGETKMPPGFSLDAEEIAALERWINDGATWPLPGETSTPGNGAAHSASGGDFTRGHWAFQPIIAPSPPALKTSDWAITPIDQFIQDKLISSGIAPVADADRRTFIRRASVDLIGIYPSMEEVEQFIHDQSPTAYETLIDRLLASPQYGERWGRHWLDAARYSDTTGSDDEGQSEFPHAYHYRDWVIRSLNEDLPYDRFLTLQLAADQVELGEDRRALAGLGFIALGRQFDGDTEAQIDDRLDTIFRTTMGVSISCARCHDHKFDPIPMADYYSLFGVFMGGEIAAAPIPANANEAAQYEAFSRQLAVYQQHVKEYLNKKRRGLLAPVETNLPSYLLAAQAQISGNVSSSAVSESPPPANPPNAAEPELRSAPSPESKHEGDPAAGQLSQAFVERFMNHLRDANAADHAVFGPWHALAAIPSTRFAADAPAIIEKIIRRTPPFENVNALVARALTSPPPDSLEELARRYDGVFQKIRRQWEAECQSAQQDGLDPPPGFSHPAREEIRQEILGDGGLIDLGDDEIRELLSEAEKTELDKLEMAVASWRNSPGAPSMAHVFANGEDPGNPDIFLRGNPETPGEEVPRRFLQLIQGETRPEWPYATSRLELARALVDPKNPLTARVIVNRIWHYHFGRGLVETPSDFGTQGARPSHPELLDWLSDWFLRDGQSLKRLHRMIMLSRVYRLGSADQPRAFAVDPDNRLLWRMNRQRLDYESLRDSLLSVSGKLDRAIGGRGFDVTTEPNNPRRAIYARIDRLNPPVELSVFDVANPDSHVSRRIDTIVPQQSLYLMNSGFLAERSRDVGELAEREASDPRGRVSWVFHRILSREPSEKEIQIMLEYLDQAAKSAPSAPVALPNPWQYGWGQVDSKGKVLQFTPFLHFTGDTWQGGPVLPDPVTGQAYLQAEDGRPGFDNEHAVIRRFVTPLTGVVRIESEVSHTPENADESDGIRARICSSRQGILRRWKLVNESGETTIDRLPVEKGDTIDFVVEPRETSESDQFHWNVTVEWLEPTLDGPLVKSVQRDQFGGPQLAPPAPLSPLAKLAQVLLMGNEFMFVD